MGCPKLTYHQETELRIIHRRKELTINKSDLKGGNNLVFGMLMPGRQYNSGEYRYGFNGYENDNEIKGTGNSVNFGARIHDPRLGRFLSIDPRWKEFSDISTYAFAANSPIQYIDENGEAPSIWNHAKVFLNKSRNLFRHGKFKTSGEIAYQYHKARFNEALAEEKWFEEGFKQLSELNKGIKYKPRTLGEIHLTAHAKSRDPDLSDGRISEYYDPVQDFEMYLDAPSLNIQHSVVKSGFSFAYGILNAPYGAFKGTSLGGSVLTYDERITAGGETAAMFAPPIMKGMKSSLKTMQLGPFASQTRGMYLGKNHAKDRGQALAKFNESVRQIKKEFDATMKSLDLIDMGIGISDETKKEITKD